MAPDSTSAWPDRRSWCPTTWPSSPPKPRQGSDLTRKRRDLGQSQDGSAVSTGFSADLLVGYAGYAVTTTYVQSDSSRPIRAHERSDPYHMRRAGGLTRSVTRKSCPLHTQSRQSIGPLMIVANVSSMMILASYYPRNNEHYGNLKMAYLCDSVPWLPCLGRPYY